MYQTLEYLYVYYNSVYFFIKINFNCLSLIEPQQSMNKLGLNWAKLRSNLNSGG